MNKSVQTVVAPVCQTSQHTSQGGRTSRVAFSDVKNSNRQSVDDASDKHLGQGYQSEPIPQSPRAQLSLSRNLFKRPVANAVPRSTSSIIHTPERMIDQDPVTGQFNQDATQDRRESTSDRANARAHVSVEGCDETATVLLS